MSRLTLTVKSTVEEEKKIQESEAIDETFSFDEDSNDTFPEEIIRPVRNIEKVVLDSPFASNLLKRRASSNPTSPAVLGVTTAPPLNFAAVSANLERSIDSSSSS
eukprot:GILI01009992.1.p1 GENE.GILI01009992.1~~GILI01009992.1.p1  ORF type:complete len:105 (-),score=21.55 GILI01009992.1:551-865(-)